MQQLILTQNPLNNLVLQLIGRYKLVLLKFYNALFKKEITVKKSNFRWYNDALETLFGIKVNTQKGVRVIRLLVRPNSAIAIFFMITKIKAGTRDYTTSYLDIMSVENDYV